MLELKGLRVSYGKTPAIKGVDITVPKGTIVTIIGSNGAGKTTTLRAIMGMLSPASGSILFEGRPIGGLSTPDVVELGIAMVPEGRKIFAGLTVIENLRMGAYSRWSEGDVESSLERLFSLFPMLKERARQWGGTLSGGEQQMLAIGRALMSGPKLLLLDEPSMGLAPKVVTSIFETISGLRDRGVTILLVEQRARVALSLADHAYVLELGRVVMEGKARDLIGDPGVVSAYLGGEGSS